MTNFILRIKDQETCLILHEHDDDDDDDDDNIISTVLLCTWFRAASRLFRKYAILPVGDL